MIPERDRSILTDPQNEMENAPAEEKLKWVQRAGRSRNISRVKTGSRRQEWQGAYLLGFTGRAAARQKRTDCGVAPPAMPQPAPKC